MIHKIRTLLSVHFAEMTAYRAELFFWMLATALPLIMMGVWAPAAEHGDVGGLTGPQVSRYFLAMFIVRQFSLVWVVYHFEMQLVTGRLSPMLLAPMNPVHRIFYAHISEQWARLPMVFVAVIGVLVLYPAVLTQYGADGQMQWWLPAWSDVLRGLAIIPLVFVLRFLLQSVWTMLSFWVERASRIEHLFFLPYMYLSGLFAPLEAFDEPVRQVALWTPFPYMMWFPANVLVGREVMPIWQGLGMMLAWGLIFYSIAWLLWRRGLKRFSAMGA